MVTSSISNIVFDYPTAPPSHATHLNAPGHSIRNSSHHFHPSTTAKIGNSKELSGPIPSEEPLRVPTRVNPTKNQSSISFVPPSSSNTLQKSNSSSSLNKSAKSLNSSTIQVTEVGAISSVESPTFWGRKSRNAGFKKEDNIQGLATFLSEKKVIDDGRPENISGTTLKRSIATPVPNEKPSSKVKTIAPPSNDDPRPNRLAQIPPPVIKEKARGKAKLKETQPSRPTFATHY